MFWASAKSHVIVTEELSVLSLFKMMITTDYAITSRICNQPYTYMTSELPHVCLLLSDFSRFILRPVSAILYSVSFWVCQTKTYIWSARLCYTRILYRWIQNSNPLTLSYDATWLSIVNLCVILHNFSKGSNPRFSGKQKKLTWNIPKE